MQKSLKKVKKIANYKCIQFAQLFMSRYSAHLLLDIYPSALVLNIELERAIELIRSTSHPERKSFDYILKDKIQLLALIFPLLPMQSVPLCETTNHRKIILTLSEPKLASL